MSVVIITGTYHSVDVGCLKLANCLILHREFSVSHTVIDDSMLKRCSLSLVPKKHTSELSRLRSKSLLQNQYCSPMLQFYRLYRLESGGTARDA